MRYRLTPQRKYRQARPRWVGTGHHRALNLLGVARAPVAGRLRLSYQSASFAPDVGATLWDPEHNTQLADLALARSRSWFDPYNDQGNGSLILQNDDDDLALAAQLHNLVDFTYRGENAATMIVEQTERKHIDVGEEGEEYTTISGRLHVVAFERAVMYPTLGVDNQPVENGRYFNWTSPFYDDSGWGAASIVTDAATAKAALWMTADYPDDTASILWASDGTILSAQPGHCWFRGVINSGLSIPARVYLWGDDSAQLAIDGVLVVGTDFPNVEHADFGLSAGLHEIAVHCENNAPGSFATTPAGVAFSIYGTDIYGNLTGLGWNSGAWMNMVPYQTDPPGITAGFVLLEVVAELQARGILAGMTVTFTELADSYGNPWPLLSNVTSAVGVDMLTLLTEMADAGYIDYWMTPAMFEFNAVVGGTRGTL